MLVVDVQRLTASRRNLDDEVVEGPVRVLAGDPVEDGFLGTVPYILFQLPAGAVPDREAISSAEPWMNRAIYWGLAAHR